jgi:hypothetical protein
MNMRRSDQMSEPFAFEVYVVIQLKFLAASPCLRQGLLDFLRPN